MSSDDDDDDIGGFYRALKAVRQQRAERNREQAADTFKDAAELAEMLGLQLHKCSDVHYQFSDEEQGWLINLYPGNGRLYADRKRRAKAPFLRVPENWTLLDVVEVAAKLRHGESGGIA